jgi:hypothetical protein
MDGSQDIERFFHDSIHKASARSCASNSALKGDRVMKHHLAVVILGAAVAVVFWAGALIGGNHKYVEYFTTTQYENTLNTTACWDTVVGELKLHPFKLELAGSYNPLGPCVLDIAVSGDCAYVVDEDSQQS